MRKLRLSLKELSIDSFDTTAADAGGRGTVLGRGDYSPLCIPTHVASDPTCAETCPSCDPAVCKQTADTAAGGAED